MHLLQQFAIFAAVCAVILALFMILPIDTFGQAKLAPRRRHRDRHSPE